MSSSNSSNNKKVKEKVVSHLIGSIRDRQRRRQRHRAERNAATGSDQELSLEHALVNALLSNSISQVQEVLEAASPDTFDPHQIRCTVTVQVDADDDVGKSKPNTSGQLLDLIFVWKQCLGEYPTLMHLAVLHVFRCFQDTSYTPSEMEQAISILHSLLDRKPNCSTTSTDETEHGPHMDLVWEESLAGPWFSPPRTPLDLALLLMSGDMFKKNLGENASAAVEDPGQVPNTLEKSESVDSNASDKSTTRSRLQMPNSRYPQKVVLWKKVLDDLQTHYPLSTDEDDAVRSVEIPEDLTKKGRPEYQPLWDGLLQHPSLPNEAKASDSKQKRKNRVHVSIVPLPLEETTDTLDVETSL